MRMVKAQKTLYDDVQEVLKTAGLNDGLGADRSGVLFYPARKTTIYPLDKDIYVTYSAYYIDEAGRGDGEPYSQIGNIAIDVYTKLERTSPEVLDMIEKIETAAFAKGYTLEMRTTDNYDYQSEIEHLSYDMVKRLK